MVITDAGAIKSLVYVLKIGTEASKQNVACALLSLALVSLLLNGSNRGKKDALTTMYKLCSIKPNKERVVSAGADKDNGFPLQENSRFLHSWGISMVDFPCEVGVQYKL